jgi:MFS family permease
MTASASRLFAVSLLARLPLAMLSIGLLVHTEHATGSYALAGLVSGAFALAQGVGGPVLGRLVDRRGQTVVLGTSALVASAALVITASLPGGTPMIVRLALAVLTGLATPPVGACLRTLLASVVEGKEALRSAYATDAAAVELTWVAGPPVVLAVGSAVSTGAALVVAAAFGGVFTLVFAGSRESRQWRPERHEERHGAMRAPGMRTLTAILLAVGLVFGSTEVAVTASADVFGATGAAGPLLGLWGIGSLIGGLVAAKLGGGARTAGGLVLLLAALGAGHMVLALAGGVVALGALILLAGAMIAPTYATVYAMVDGVAPRGTATEAFSWLATATAVGTSVGAAGAGSVVDAAGPGAAFVVAGLAAAVAAGIAITRARTLPGGTPALAHA